MKGNDTKEIPVKTHPASAPPLLPLPASWSALALLGMLWGQGLAATLYVENSVGQSVLALDADSGRVLATIALPSAPRGLALCPEQNRLYVAGGDAGTVSVVETVGNKVSRTVKVGSAAWGLALSPDCARLYTTGAGNGRLAVINTADYSVRAVEVGHDPQNVALDPQGRWLLSLNFGRPSSLSLLDPLTLARERTLSVADGPHSWALSPDGKWLALGAVDSRKVQLIDTQSLQVVSSYHSEKAPEGLAFRKNDELWVSALNANYVDVLHLMQQAGKPMLMPQRYTTRVFTGQGPFGIAFSGDGRWAYVSAMRTGRVVKIDAQNRQVVARFEVGGEPHRLVWSERR